MNKQVNLDTPINTTLSQLALIKIPVFYIHAKKDCNAKKGENPQSLNSGRLPLPPLSFLQPNNQHTILFK